MLTCKKRGVLGCPVHQRGWMPTQLSVAWASATPEGTTAGVDLTCKGTIGMRCKYVAEKVDAHIDVCCSHARAAYA